MTLAGISLGTDLSRYFHGRLPRIALATIIVMPLLYGAMYLWAFWNPFAEVNKIPVALVNEDRGASGQGGELRAGDEVARALIDSGQLHLTEMSAQEAADGVAAGDYYFSITLPADFSESIASPSGSDPRQAQIRFAFNDANNYLASIIGQNASREIVNQINAQIGERTVGTVVSGLTDAGQGLQQAAGGAQQLAAGLGTADDGARRLAGGADTLSSGLDTARAGSAELAVGTQRLADSVDRTTGPLLQMLDRVGAVGVNPDDVAVAAQHLSGAVRSTTDRLAALNVNTAQAAAICSPVPILRCATPVMPSPVPSVCCGHRASTQPPTRA